MLIIVWLTCIQRRDIELAYVHRIYIHAAKKVGCYMQTQIKIR